MQTGESSIKKHKLLFQSTAVFPGWILVVNACILFVPGLFLFFKFRTILEISTLFTLAGLFVLGLFTIREKKWNYLGWISLTIALGMLLFTIPNGRGLILWVMAAGLVSASSYFGFTYKETSPLRAYIFGIILLVVFVSHVFILSSPQAFGLKIQGDELSGFSQETVSEFAAMEPIEFVKTNQGRKIAIKVYDVSLFISQEKLDSVVRENPQPIVDVQKSLSSISTTYLLDASPYAYIMNVYLYSFIESIRK